MRKIAAGNWKMNGMQVDLAEARALAVAHPVPDVEVVLCLPATLLTSAAQKLAGTGIALGGQDCHPAASGAHTGDIAAALLAEAGARYVIVGHSERRADHGDTSEIVRTKAQAALDAGLMPIVCVGETLDDRRAGRALDVVAEQVAASMPPAPGNAVLAYEPVWAIGTGEVATPDQIAEMHAMLRDRLPDVPLLYGGSVKGANAAELFAVPNVDGALVGGASLTAEAFSPIVAALEATV
ncbi:MAG: triose-phosphate isomerase [Shimia sp.]